MIQAFSPDRSDDTLDVSSLPRGPWSAEDLSDAQQFDLLAELVPANPISVPQHQLRGAVEWKGFDHLLCRGIGTYLLQEVVNPHLIDERLIAQRAPLARRKALSVAIRLSWNMEADAQAVLFLKASEEMLLMEMDAAFQDG